MDSIFTASKTLVGPPIAVLVIGLVLRWIARGFRASPPTRPNGQRQEPAI
jgi:hypothetical protein